MGKLNKRTVSNDSSPHSHSGSSRWKWLAGCGLLVVVAILALALLPEGKTFRGRRRQPSGSSDSPTSAGTGAIPTVGTADKAKSDPTGHSSDEIVLESLQKLVGRWQRSDADYVLKIKSVDAQGKLDAVYLNPNSIHVEKASAHSHGTNSHVTIELRDVNYPGCIYDLQYDAAKDELKGSYFQAALGETYDVAFVRSE